MKITITLLASLLIFNVHSQDIEFTEHLIERLDWGAYRFKLLDFDGDGDKDVVVSVIIDFGQGNEFKWYENINGSFVAKYLSEFNDPSQLVKFKESNDTEFHDVYVVSGNKIFRYQQISGMEFKREEFFTINADLTYNFEITDFNNDNKFDIVTFEKNNDLVSVAVYLNNGNNFTRIDLGLNNDSVSLNYFKLYSEIYIKDINSDGLEDIVYFAREIIDVSNMNLLDDYIIYMKNDGNGGFEKTRVGRLYNTVRNLDNNVPHNVLTFTDEGNDGLLGLYLTGNRTNDFKPNIFTQNTEDNFVNSTFDISMPRSYNYNKFLQLNQDNDSDVDLINIPYGRNQENVFYFENSDNNFYTSTELFGISGEVHDAVTIDMNNDGLEDIILSRYFRMYQYKQISGLNFQKQPLSDEFFREAKLVEIYNFNHDQHKDIIAVSRENSGLFLYINNDSTSFERIFVDGSDALILGIGSNDFNHDGLQDILTVAKTEYSSPIELHWYENVNSEYFTKHTITTLTGNVGSVKKVEFSDLDNDGDVDIILFGEHSVDWVENNDNNFAESKVIISGRGFFFGADQDYTFIDFDNDGDIDVTYSAKEVSSGSARRFTVWYELNDNHEYIKHNIVEDIDTYYVTFKPADLNNNGLIDFIAKNEHNEQFIWINTGSDYHVMPFDDFTIISTTNEGGGIRLKDMNNDGLIDVVSRDNIYLNQGNFHFISTDINYDFGTNRSNKRLILDMNGDGLNDIVFVMRNFVGGLKLLKQVAGAPAPIPMITIMGLMIMMFLIMVTFWKFSINQGRGICLTDRLKSK